ncbi:NAD-dependent epimerase/dehydratase family protein [Aestuariibaculum sediminum]|uniref:NAD(P)-dependent oxidoreductase n=1 Tax=Aestuariibaculum sediminum TaxID=2770637 RepID=A0A8J6QFK2_9FLAO|nr:NAD(P)-dependent oxidoreductase [Aestuariibaculum sediminum]MBD0831204.1 NAD(P)-dependent oxidoreductase [Aestuariibaculum sediminum]
MVKTAIIFGGAGYIGKNLLNCLLKENLFDKIYVYDIQKLVGFENQVQENRLVHEILDVRRPILNDIGDVDVNASWIFNFAAIHREPGHEYQEYFDTNIPGAENINEFARKTGIKNLFFTSSIAPYGKSLHERTENSTLYPETAYGISKGFAEKIHKQWLAEDASRRLIIVRPSVIFGPNDPGNVYRMVKALKKGTFVLPNGGGIIKGYGYIYGLVESMIFTINQKDSLIIYNYAENPLLPLKDIVKIAKEELGYSKPTIKLSVKMLALIAFFVQNGFKLIGKKSDIHPVRVRKAGFPTNIKPQYLIDNGFEFKYNFRNALKHWKSVCPEDFN